MTSKIRMFTGFIMAFGIAANVSAQVLDGEYWEARLSAKTRIIQPLAAKGEGVPGPGDLELVRGKVSKVVAYLRSDWDEESNSYDLTAWTQAADLSWVESTDAGSLEPFGAGFPDSEDAFLEVDLDLDPTSEEGDDDLSVNIDGLATLKIRKEKEGTPGVQELQQFSYGEATGGTFVLSFKGEATDPLAYDLGFPEIVDAVEALPTIGEGNLGGAGGGGGGGSGGPVGGGLTFFFFVFHGALAHQDVPLIMVDSDETTGGTGVVITEHSAGAPPGPLPLKTASLKLDSTGATLDGDDFGGIDNELIGSPKFSAKRVTTDKLPFTVKTE